MNKTIKRKYWVCFSIIAVILLVDQAVKLWIKTHLAIGDEISLIGDWCKIHFVENEGMAFGFSFGGTFGKLLLSLIRLAASVFIIILLNRLIKKNAGWVMLVSLSLIFVGAVGNLVDCCFYGICFSESTFEQVAVLFPEGGGYGKFLFGKVVDMFYFPLCEWTWPSWMPWLGGRHAEFFNAIFNVADAAICVGVTGLVIDQLFFAKSDDKVDEDSESLNEQTTISERNSSPEVE
ncbi:MAG: lipoprotein signal peptidase [Bacteroidales bacterium]|nr:lipoprotein signal peptidase [Bacteroidales bacterium]